MEAFVIRQLSREELERIRVVGQDKPFCRAYGQQDPTKHVLTK
jgi:hypothetical protein